MIQDIVYTYTYKVHGLIIRSEILFTELMPVNPADINKYDATISLGKVPREIEGAAIKNKILQVSKAEMYFFIEGLAHYYIGYGNSIIIEPEENSQIKDIKIYLLGGCIGALLAQRNIIGIHGGTVVLDGKGVIVTGHPGAGKSTLTAAFSMQGYPFLSDDVSALGKDEEGNITIYPSYPQQKLCRDTLEKMGCDADQFSVIDPSRDKYAVPIGATFLNCEVTLAAIFEIGIGTENKAKIDEVFGSEKLKIILRNIYAIEIISRIGLEPVFFKKCMELAGKIDIYRITRPKDGLTVREQIELIMHALRMKEKCMMEA